MKKKKINKTKNDINQKAVSQPENKNPDLIYLSNITHFHWLILFIFLILNIIGFWQFFLPFKAERHFRNAYHYDAFQKYKFAVEEYVKAVKYAPWETHYYTSLGRTFEKVAKLVKNNDKYKLEVLTTASNLYRHIIDMDPVNPWFKNRLATIYFEMEKIVKNEKLKKEYHRLGAEMIDQAAENDNQNPLFQLNKAYYLHKTGKVDEAIKYYETVVHMDKRMLEARYNLAGLYREKKMLDKALDHYTSVYKQNPDFPSIKLAIASSYMLKNDLRNAVIYLEENIKSEPRHFETIKNLSAIYFSLKQYRKSLESYKKLITYYPEKEQQFHQYYIQSAVYAKLPYLAEKELVKYIKKYPADKMARKQSRAVKELIKKVSRKKN
ncbi:MAG: tetratricopeptide repeat protein [bacterium]|nr:tetratricopeptide repeat protein [bacterium]